MRRTLLVFAAFQLLTIYIPPTVPKAWAANPGLEDVQTRSPWVDVRRYGTITFGQSATVAQKEDNARAIQFAIDNVTDAGATIQIPPGIICVAGDSIKIRRDRIHIKGMGIHATDIYADSGVVFDFDKTRGGTLNQCSISDLSLVGNTAARKIAIRITDVSQMEVSRISTGTWTGNTSIGLQYRGREFLTVDTVNLYADRPISIEDNPNSTIDIDHAHFNNCFLGAQDAKEANVHIASGINLTDVLFDGYQSWVLGKYGLYWHDTTSTGSSMRLTLKNVRYEQPMSSSGYAFYLSHNYLLNGFVLEGAIWGAGATTKGIYLRKVTSGVIRDSIYAGTAEALNIDGSVGELSVSNAWFQAGSANAITGQNILFSTPPYPGSTGIGDTVIFGATTRPIYMKHVVIMGTKTSKYTGVIDNESPGWLVTVPGGTGPAYKIGMIHVAGSDDGGRILEGGSAIFNRSGVKLLDHTTNFGTGDAAGKLTIVWLNGATIAIKNRTDAPLNLVLSVDWQ